MKGCRKTPFLEEMMVNNIFETEIRTHWTELKRLVISIINDDSIADDILQTSFLKALTTKTKPESDKTILPWFKTILKNTAFDVLRTKKRESEKELQERVDFIVHEDMFTSLACRCVLDLLTTLSSDDQYILRQLELNEISLQEISDMLGISKNTAKVRRHRARQRLKEQVMRVCQVGTINECDDCDCS